MLDTLAARSSNASVRGAKLMCLSFLPCFLGMGFLVVGDAMEGLWANSTQFVKK
jgi:hypothetical protein